MLAGCTSGGSDPGGGAGRGGGSRDALATLTVHIALFGGPMRPDGGMALSDSPAGSENVTTVDAAGRKIRARTNADGVTTLRLKPGRYTVFSTYCGTDPRHVVLSAAHTVRVQIDCAVP
jgi:hypothetical protein